MEEEHLIKLAETLASHLGRSEATISNWCAGHARFFSRLRAGKSCTLEGARKALKELSTHWPDDLEWPSDIPRPPRAQKEVA